jgi:Holliday junction resolvase RusA-like endonuclease
VEGEGMREVIRGTCPSKSNCYRIGHKGLFKTEALKSYEKSFYLQCSKYRNANIKGLFEFNIQVFYPSNRADLDNAMKVVLDCLQQVKAIENDNKCVKIIAEKFVDKIDPRIEFEIVEI